VAEPLRRRDRVRAATVQEIKETARRVLVEQGSGGLSLRAVARDMGITAPALYRYFPSREDLLEHLIADLYDEVSAALERARDALPADNVAGRLLTVSRTFRAWALAHPAEFGLLFGSPIKGFARPHEAAAAAGGAAAGEGATTAGGAAAGEDLAQQAGQRFGAVFAGLVAEIYLDRQFPVPADDEIEPALRAQLETWCSTLPEPLPLGVMQVFLSCWIRLYGSVCMEAFGHLRFAVADAEPMFEAELRSLARLLGIAERLPPAVVARGVAGSKL
jgi:AcrR family transcriptional regulator